ncbi:cobalamin biosynthesis protein [Celeribacter neptunius]|uniref:Cobalt-precorrin 5A hydrolase n=1 Tax=Celeribacter neptunius TaxID=588602 RepID=A0A1I3PRF9_9RHOB|nr:cobalamin biosynthesis protein [Celeribacter neptunius]SFJ23851.1 cobalt-precorrin 5A hydrolase [Celeribacter neptunius]
MRVAGMGFQRSAPPAALRAALASVGAVDHVATARSKAAALAQILGCDVRGADVAGIATPTMSQASLNAHGTGSVAEAAALVVAGPNARLLEKRKIIGGVTIAVAEGDGR